MNITHIMLSFILVVAIVSGLNLFTGDVLTQYNNTGAGTNLNTTMSKYNTGYVTWVSSMAESTRATVQKTPEGILGQIITGIFWILDSIKNFLSLPAYIGMTLTDLSGTSSEFSGIITIPTWVWTLITMMVLVSLVGYLLYLLIGKSGDNSGYV
jgi:hypothetical protein